MHTDLYSDQARPADIGDQTCLLGEEQRKLESPIAIVGVGLRMPGGINDLDSLWRMLLEGRSAIGGVPPDRWNQERFYHTDASASGRLASRWGGFVRRAKEFDAAFWGISPREAARMDPQQRWLLEIAWEAIEDAGLRPNDLRGQRVGVYVGASSHDYGTAQLEDLLRLDVHSNTGGASSILANRLSYLLDLRGPSLVVDTACSSALVAIAMAVDAIRSGVCRAALTGGVNSLFLPNSGVGFSKAGMLSPTGQCLAFDARANGYVRSEGAGLLLLKPLADAVADGDSIYAVIRGAAINSDGRTSSLTVPSAAGQADMLREAYRNAGVNPLDVSYVEAHGTGTPVGDPIEANALSQVLSQHRGQDHPLLIGSIKANLGHLESASGIAGMLKAVLVLQRGVIPGQANFKSLNKHIDGDELRLRVVRQNSPLSIPAGSPPIVGVNSFGFGGTNAHVVLAAAPVAERPSVAAGQFASQTQSTTKSQSAQQVQATKQEQDAPIVLADRPHVLPISAHDSAALRLTAQSYLRTLSGLSGALPDFCSSAGDRRQHQSHRLVVMGLNAAQLSAGLQDWLAATAVSENQLTAGKQWVYGEAVQGATGQAISSRKTTDETNESSGATSGTCGPAMVFTGQGCQWTGMGRTLFEREPSFRETLFEIDEIFASYAGWSLIEAMQDDAPERINLTIVAQPAIFAIQVGLVRLWRSWGVEPACVIGHSVGEVAAAWTAGALSLADAVKLVYHRSRLQGRTGGFGRMAAVGLTAQQGESLLSGYEGQLAVTAINSPSLITIGGNRDAMENVVAELERRDVFVRWLKLDYAFHTHQMDPIEEELKAALADLRPAAATIPFISSVTGELFDTQQLDGAYWWRNVREPVQFSAAIEAATARHASVFLEIGPHPSMRTSIESIVQDRPQTLALPSLSRHQDASTSLVTSLARLHIHGGLVSGKPFGPNWQAINQASGKFIRQPAYAWNRQPFWLSTISESSRLVPPDHPLLQTRLSVAQPTWQTVLDPAVLTYLKDHQIWDAIVFPAAAYIEIGLAVAKVLFPDQKHQVEDLQLHAALFVSAEADTRLQVVYNSDDLTIQIHSSNDGISWDFNGQCRLVPDLSRRVPAKPLAVAQSTIVNSDLDIDDLVLDHDQLYDQLRQAGYGFGELFSLIERLQFKRDETIAEIKVPKTLHRVGAELNSGNHVFHPAILDACFQASLRVTSESSEDASLFLPTSIGRVRLCREIDSETLIAVAHNFSTERDQRSCDIDVFSVDGERLAEIRQFRVTKAMGASRSPSRADGLVSLEQDIFYRVGWRQQRLPGTRIDGSCQFPDSSALLTELTDARKTIVEERGLDHYFKVASPRINELTVASIQNAYVQLGWGSRFGWTIGQTFTTAELLANEVFIPEYHELLATQLHWLAESGWLKRVSDNSSVAAGETRWEVLREFYAFDVGEQLRLLEIECPELCHDVKLGQAFLPCMADILSGDVKALDRGFANGSSHLLENFYTRNPDCASYRELLATAIERLSRNLPARRTLRVLEVGAGTGAMTSAMLDVLTVMASDKLLEFEYHFTDVSPSFLSAARSRFAAHTNVTFGILDLERPPRQQGIEAGCFDVVIAANVLHATQDLRRSLTHLRDCLADGGALLLNEITGRLPFIDNTFGLLPGWWRFRDRELRSWSPLIDRQQWGDLLGEAGWKDVSVIATDTADRVSSMALIMARPAWDPAESSEIATEGLSEQAVSRPHLLIFVDQAGRLEQLVKRYREIGGEVTLIRYGDNWRESFAKVPWQSVGDWLVVHGWSLDDVNPVANTAALLRTIDAGVHSGMRLAQVIDAENLMDRVRICFLTQDSQLVSDEDQVDGFAGGLVTGFAGVLKNESSSLGVTTIDLPSGGRGHDDFWLNDLWLDDLLAEIMADVGERNVAFRDGVRFVSRLQREQLSKWKPRRKSLADNASHYRLEMRRAGRLEDLSWNATSAKVLAENELEIRVEAGGINFRDVMKALAMYPGNPPDRLWFGDDVAGVVERVGAAVQNLRVGDRVVGVAPWAFRSHAVTDHRLLIRCPESISMTAAATIPTVFLTAQFAIDQVARMRRGESILIHAAAGGVGQAAIQVAQAMGLEIFATAGSPAKRELLRDLGVQHVMDSRTFEFADEVMKITDNYGVDVVLNSLAGEFLTKSLAVIAPFGRFLEIGKADVYGDRALRLAALKNNVSYHVIDLAQWIVERPESVAGLLDQLRASFEQGIYRPLTHRIYPASQVIAAFRAIAKGEHVGKNVLDFAAIPRDEPIIGPSTELATRFPAEGTFLVTGGCRGFGWEVAKWLATRGVRSLVLMSRSGPDELVAREIAQLREAGIAITETRGDVTIREDVDAVVQGINAGDYPLIGVVHAAMVIDDDFVTHLDTERFDRVLHPKALGAWHLHDATQGMAIEHFIMFSSISSVLGAPRQAHYNAGNEFLSALARHRRAMGLNALSINWSAIEGAGFVHRNTATAEYLKGTGLAMLPLSQAMAVLDELTLLETDVLAVAPIDWERVAQMGLYKLKEPFYEEIRNLQPSQSSGSLRKLLKSAPRQQHPTLLRQFLIEQVAGVFGIGTAEIDPDLSLTRLGLDSLMAVELVNRIESELVTNLPMSRLLTGPSINSLVDLLLPSIVPDEGEAGHVPSSDDQRAQFLADACWDEQIILPSQRAIVDEKSNRFLTGVTGFLGAHLLGDLLKAAEGRVTCLVRATDIESARQRIASNLERYGIDHSELLDRVDVLLGDLALPRFGLSEQAFDDLAASVDVIFHNGADVNLAKSYDSLRDVNVGGTREILRLACREKLKPIHYVSTYTVHATSESRGKIVAEDASLPPCEQLLYGYSQTKWVCEMLMREARQRGLDVKIYRPGHITGDSTTGIGNEDDLLHTLILTCIKIGSVPLSELELDATPVDYVSRGIVHLSSQVSDDGEAIYHLTNPVPLRGEVLREWLEDSDVGIEVVSPQRWREQLLAYGKSSTSNEHLIQLMADMLRLRESLAEDVDIAFLPRLSCQSTAQTLHSAGIICPPVDVRLLEIGAGYLQRIGLLASLGAGPLSCS